MDSNKTAGEEARRQLHKNAASNLVYGSFNKQGEWFGKKTNDVFSDLSLININCIFCIWFIAKTIWISSNICPEAIQNDSKINWMLQDWTEACHQIFGWCGELIKWKFKKNVGCMWSSIKNVYNLSKQKFSIKDLSRKNSTTSDSTLTCR